MLITGIAVTSLAHAQESSISGLHRDTRTKVIAADSEYKEITGTNFTIVGTLPNIDTQAERVTDIINMGRDTASEILPGCSKLNYGIGVTIDAVSVMMMPNFSEIMGNHGLVPLSSMPDGSFFNAGSPHLQNVNLAIETLKQPESGKAWLWEQETLNLKTAMEEQDEKELELVEVEELMEETEQERSRWTGRRDTLIAQLSITLAQMQARLQLLISLNQVNDQIAVLEAQKTELDTRAASLDVRITMHDENVDRYNADVVRYTNDVDQLERDIATWERERDSLNAYIDSVSNGWDDMSTAERDAARDRIDQWALELDAQAQALFARSDALEAEHIRLQNWSTDIEAEQTAIIEAVEQLNAATTANENQLADATAVRGEIQTAINALPPVTDIQAAELVVLAQEGERLDSLEAQLRAEKRAIENDLEEISERIVNASYQASVYLEQIKEAVDTINFQITLQELGQVEGPASDLQEQLEDMEKFERLREKLEGILPDPKLYSWVPGMGNVKGVSPHIPLGKNDKFNEIFKALNERVKGKNIIPKTEAAIDRYLGLQPYTNRFRNSRSRVAHPKKPMQEKGKESTFSKYRILKNMKDRFTVPNWPVPLQTNRRSGEVGLTPVD